MKFDTAAFIEEAQSIGIEFAPKLVAAIAIFIVGRIVAKILTRLARNALTRMEADQMLVKFVGSIAYALLLTVVLLAALAQLGVHTTSFIAVLGAAGLAIALALQDSLGNFAAGVLVVLFRPYRSGDFVEVAGISGLVDEVQIFTTVLRTPDNKRVIVPNGQITSSTIVNYSAHDTRRVDLVFGCSYDDNVGQVKRILTDIAGAGDKVLDDPAPNVFVKELADSSVNFGMHLWVRTADYWPVLWHITETVKRRFDEEGISIPYPQQDNHVVISERQAKQAA